MRIEVEHSLLFDLAYHMTSANIEVRKKKPEDFCFFFFFFDSFELSSFFTNKSIYSYEYVSLGKKKNHLFGTPWLNNHSFCSYV
jgi:hypothetical protein